MEEKESSSSLSGQPSRSTNSIVSFARVVVASKTFDWIITGVILLQALVLAFEATPELHSFGEEGELLEAMLFNLVQTLVITVFIVEAAFRLTANIQSRKGISETVGIALTLRSLSSHLCHLQASSQRQLGSSDC